MRCNFIKMDGTGNDFIIFDARNQALPRWNPALIQQLAARKHPVTGGADQIIIIEPPQHQKITAAMRIFNADGGEVDACGNATRCVAWLLMEELQKDQVTLSLKAGLLNIARVGDRNVAVDMGKPHFEWQEIPLVHAEDTLHLPIREGALSDPVAVSMGNPHMVFFVKDSERIDFSKGGLGKRLEHHPLYPARANVGVAEIVDKSRMRLRVFERGVGETLSCGTGACAAVVAAVRRGLTDRQVTVVLRGGNLSITWKSDDHVIMAGPVFQQFEGTVEI